MQKVYVVSKCIGIESDGCYKFKFNGNYHGSTIYEIVVEVTFEKLEIHEEYLLLLENVRYSQSKLYGKASSIKKLFATFPH